MKFQNKFSHYATLTVSGSFPLLTCFDSADTNALTYHPQCAVINSHFLPPNIQNLSILSKYEHPQLINPS